MARGSPREEFGPYLVYESLGEGGMAVVHRAEQAGIEGFKKAVALKRMLPHIAANEEMVRSFVREARLASFLRHANVAQTYELGKVGDTYFIAMELVEGRNLRDILRRCNQLKRRLPVPLTLNILNQICDALDYAHNLRDHQGTPLGIIHRDVSPSNIIVSRDGVVKLIDFGIAKASAAGMQTMSGTIKGKYGYMAPEYLAGRIDARADLFAVGVIAHELLTGHPLFTTNDDIETLQRVRDMPIAPPSHRNPLVPADIDNVVMTALERDPDRRWQHATALRNAMTTLTRRLDMVVSGPEVVQWLDTMDFASATLDEGERGPSTSMGDSVVISVEHPLTVQLGAAPVIPSLPMPVGTPAHTITAQPNVPTIEIDQRHDREYLAAVARFEANNAPTQVRAPDPTPMPPAATLIGLGAPGEARATTGVKPVSGRPSRLTAVLLVVLAVAVLGTAIYFLLPLFS